MWQCFINSIKCSCQNCVGKHVKRGPEKYKGWGDSCSITECKGTAVPPRHHSETCWAEHAGIGVKKPDPMEDEKYTSLPYRQLSAQWTHGPPRNISGNVKGCNDPWVHNIPTAQHFQLACLLRLVEWLMSLSQSKNTIQKKSKNNKSPQN